MALTGDMLSPFSPTNSPCSNSSSSLRGSVWVTCVGHASSGRVSCEVRVSAPPTEVPQIPLLIEYLAFAAVYSTPCLFRY